MATIQTNCLYSAPSLPGHIVYCDTDGQMKMFPAVAGGYASSRPYRAHTRGLVPWGAAGQHACVRALYGLPPATI